MKNFLLHLNYPKEQTCQYLTILLTICRASVVANPLEVNSHLCLFTFGNALLPLNFIPMKNEQNTTPRTEAEVYFSGMTTAEIYKQHGVTNAQDLMLSIIWKQLFNSHYGQKGNSYDDNVVLCMLDLKFEKAKEAAAFERKQLQNKLSEMVVSA